MKRQVFFLVTAFCLLFAFSNVKATTYTWAGGTSGSWTTNSNWSPSTGYPGSSGVADIAKINTSNATITLGSTVTIALLETTSFGISGITISVSSGFTLNISGGITTSQPSSLLNSFIFAGAGTTKIGGTISPGFDSSFSISAGGTVYFLAGTVFDESSGNPHGILTNNGTLNILAGSAVKLGDFSSLVNTGTIHSYTTTYTVSGSGSPAAAISNSGTIIDHGSTFNLTGQNSTITNSGPSANFYGRGTTIATSSGNTGINITNSNSAAVFKLDSGAVVNLGNFQGALVNSGIFYAGTSNSACTINLTAQSTSVTNTGTFYLASTSIIYPTGITVAITNTSPGVFTLQSDANGSAAIGAFSGTATCTGTFNVERYFQGGATISNGRYVYRNYRIISSPVNTGTASLISALNYIVGATAGLTTTASSTTNAFVTGAAGGNTSAGNPSLYLYREAIVPSNTTFTSGNFIGLTSITSPTALHTSDGGTSNTIPIGNGVFFFFRGAATNWATRTQEPFIVPDNVTLTSTGSINKGNVAVKYWYTGSTTLGYTVTGVGTGSNTNTAVRGFNMVGNPYPCSIDWNTAFSGTGITRTNVNPTIWVYNPVTNQYDTYITTSSSTGTSNGGGTDGSGYATKIIASGQGFFVQANNGGAANLTFKEAAKSATSQPTGSYLLMGTPAGQNTAQQILRLKLAADSLNCDNIAITFNSDASEKYSGAEDAEYLPGINAMEGLSSLSSDSVRLSINSLPLPKQTQEVIRLNVEARKTGTYTFQRTALNAIPQIYDIWLMDKYKKDSLDIRKYASYVFDVNLTDTNSFGNSRFQLVIRQNPALGMRLLDFAATKANGGAQIAWKTENEQNYTNFTVQRSTNNGTTFNDLTGFLSTAQGTYSADDKNPPDSIDQYRLKLVDLNGTITYSKVVTLMYSNAGNVAANNISIYPNPASSVINLAINQDNSSTNAQHGSLTSNLSALQMVGSAPSLISSATSTQSYEIKIISITGSVIKTATSAQPNWQANVNGLLPGTYIIQVLNNSDKSLVGKSTFIKL